MSNDMQAAEFDTKLDNDENIIEHLDLSQSHRPGCPQRATNFLNDTINYSNSQPGNKLRVS
jgi:hypothetical protein